MTVKAVIFDVDGTLVDSRDQHVGSWKKALSEVGVDLDEEAIQSQMGRRKPEIVKALIPAERAKDEKLLERIIVRKTQIYVEQSSRVRSVTGARSLIESLHAGGILVCLATSATATEVNEHITRLHVADIVDAVLSSEDVTRSKPDPEIIEKALDRMGVSANQAVVVGDSPHDIEAARAAGVRAIGVLTGGYSADELRAAGADRICRSVAEIDPGLFGRIGR